jgi:hypothetical protein
MASKYVIQGGILLARLLMFFGFIRDLIMMEKNEQERTKDARRG